MSESREICFEKSVEYEEIPYKGTLTEIKQITNKKGKEGYLIIVELDVDGSEHSYYDSIPLKANSMLYRLSKALKKVRQDEEGNERVDLNLIEGNKVKVTLRLDDNGIWYIKTIDISSSARKPPVRKSRREKPRPRKRLKSREFLEEDEDDLEDYDDDLDDNEYEEDMDEE